MKLLLLPLLVAAVAATPVASASDSKAAGRVFLSSGEVVEVLYSKTANTHLATSTLTARFSSGTVTTVSAKDDYEQHREDMRISDGKTVLELHLDSGYVTAGLPVPLQVKVGDEMYRVLLKENTVTNDQKKMQAAVAKLPASFLTALQQLVPIGESAECSIPVISIVPELFEGTRPKDAIVSVKRLEPSEIEALKRDAVK